MSHVRDKYDKAGKSLFEDSNAYFSLSQVLTDILHDSSIPGVYLIVDALDECESGLSQLLDLISRTASTSRVKWLVSSRHRDAIEERLRSDKGRMKLSLELNAHSHVANAVTSYINHKVEELARLKQYKRELQDDVRCYIQTKAGGTFLWVSLVCRQLAETSLRKTLSVLQTFPPGLRPFYQRMMEQMEDMRDKEDLEICKQILAAVVLTYRPTHLKELHSVVCLPEDLLDDMASLEELVGLCGSFLTIREGFIYVVHQSVKDYLNTRAEPNIFPNGRMEVQCRILSRSLQAMSDALRRDMCNLRDPGWSIGQIGSINLDPLARIRYACVYWIEHLCEIDGSLYSQVGLCDNGTINIFLNKHLLHWLEALSLMRSMSNGVTMSRKLKDMVSVSSESSTIPGLILS